MKVAKHYVIEVDEDFKENLKKIATQGFYQSKFHGISYRVEREIFMGFFILIKS